MTYSQPHTDIPDPLPDVPSTMDADAIRREQWIDHESSTILDSLLARDRARSMHQSLLNADAPAPRMWRTRTHLMHDPTITMPVPVIEGALAEGDILALAGYSGAGKTTVVCELIYALTMAEPLMGEWDVPERRRTILWDGEQTPSLLKRNLGLLPLDLEADGLLSITGFDIAPLLLDTEYGIAQAKLLLAAEGDIAGAVWVIDNRGRFSSMDEVGSDAAPDRLYRNIRQLAAELCLAAIVMLHHSPKTAQGKVFGSMAHESNSATVWEFVRKSGTNTSTLTQIKCRSYGKERALTLTYDPDTRRMTAQTMDPKVDVTNTHRLKVFTVILASGDEGASVSTIHTQVNNSKGGRARTDNVLVAMQSEGLIEVRDVKIPGGRTVKRYFALASTSDSEVGSES